MNEDLSVTCDSCAVGFELDLETEGCKVSLCPDTALPYRDSANTTCVDACPPGEGVNNIYCTACSEDCLECTFDFSGTSTCTACDTLNLENGACVAECTAPLAVLDQVCLECPASCTENDCYYDADSSSLLCNSCADPDKINVQGECLEGCADRKFYNADTLTCDDCGSDCADCTSFEVCTACDTNFLIEKNADDDWPCVTACKDGFYLHPHQNAPACERCHESCTTCGWAGIDGCTTCPDGQVLDSQEARDTHISSGSDAAISLIIAQELAKGECVNSCQARDGPISNVCFDCPDNCASCSENRCNEDGCDNLYKFEPTMGTCPLDCHNPAINFIGCHTCTTEMCETCLDGFEQLSIDPQGHVECQKECNDPLTYIADDQISCANCDPGCIDCDKTTGECSICDMTAVEPSIGQGVRPAGRGSGCEAASCSITGCDACEWNFDESKFSCTTCAEGYAALSDGTCWEINCEVNQFYDEAATDCADCDAALCSTCRSLTWCTSCPDANPFYYSSTG